MISISVVRLLVLLHPLSTRSGSIFSFTNQDMLPEFICSPGSLGGLADADDVLGCVSCKLKTARTV